MTTATQTKLATPAEVLRLLRWTRAVALDLETTSLNPRTGRIRLLSVSDGPRTLVMDCFEHPIQQLLPALKQKLLVCHNAAFDLGFLFHAGLRELPETVCTMLLSQLLDGVRRPTGWHGLGPVVERHLGRKLDKELQGSDWSGPLSAGQLEYAATDAEVLPRLHTALTEQLEKSRQVTVSDVELGALPFWVWLTQTGVTFDADHWLSLEAKAVAEVKALGEKLNALVPAKGTPDLYGNTPEWNWNSPAQVEDALGLLGFHVGSTNDYQLAEIDHPFADLMRDRRGQAQLVKMYGTNWLKAATIENGRLYLSWVQIGTETGRTTCREPNAQQIPRGPVYRACFRAAPGCVLVKADYATLQMRLACRRAQDRAMWAIFEDPKNDVHAATGLALLGKSTLTKDERQIAKSANFLLTFGGSADGLRTYCKTKFGVGMTKDQAERHRRAFLTAYPQLADWHRQAFNSKSRETRSAIGRRRILHEGEPATELLNTPVQADEADGAKQAMGLLWKRRHECPDARPVLFNHDEIVMEAPADQGEQVKAWLTQAMLDGMQPLLDPVKCQVDAKIVPNWGGG